MFYQPLGKPCPLRRVIVLSITTLMLYYGWYKWIIQEKLRRSNGYGCPNTLCMLSFVLGVSIPQALWTLVPDVPGWFGWGSLLSMVWIYIVQLRLYRTVNPLYRRDGLKELLRIGWLFYPQFKLNRWLTTNSFLESRLAKHQHITVNSRVVHSLSLVSANA